MRLRGKTRDRRFGVHSSDIPKEPLGRPRISPLLTEEEAHVRESRGTRVGPVSAPCQRLTATSWAAASVRTKSPE